MTDVLLTVPEVSRQLAVAESTVRSWIRKRRIQFVRLGRAVRIPRPALHELLERGLVKPKEDE